MDCSLEFPEPCPGRYCGRQFNLTDGESCYSECRACPTGFRILNGSSECVECDGEAVVRDYLFLGFYFVVCVTVRLALLGLVNISKQPSLPKLCITISSILETGLAMLLTLLVLHPRGSLTFHSCSVETVTDFYPIFFNPSLDYVHTIHCTYEVVYPLYTMVFIFLGFSFAAHLLALSLLVPLMWRFKASVDHNAELFWLIAFPVVMLVHAVLPGILYYSFEYICIITSLVVFVVVTTIVQKTTFGFKNTLRVYSSPEYWVFMTVCMVIFAFGIVSLTNASTVEFRAKLLPLILAPPIVHPILSYFASPQTYLIALGMQSYRNFYQH